MDEPQLLTDEQRVIVELPWPTKTLITAGPGTGKTHVVIHRIWDLIDRQQLLPGSQLLVLSFSRAAVYEIRRRLGRLGGDAVYTRVATFDSFSTQLLGAADPNGAWIGGTYDDRIRAATALLSTATIGVTARLGEIKHVIVDEAQDLVGVRAELVIAILAAVSGGFTLLGDPAQGIYTFQLPEEERYVGGHAIHNWARSTFGTTLVAKALTVNKRAMSQNALKAQEVGAKLNATNADYTAILSSLASTIRLLPNAGDPAITLADATNSQKRFAILCRNTGQALVMSRCLFESRIHHRFQRRATDRAVPVWVADVASRLTASMISKGALLDILRDVDCNGLDALDAWLMLRHFDQAGQARTTNFDQVAQAIRSGRIPDELIDLTDSPITISTTHRAKGLEFDEVFLFESDIWGEPTAAVVAEEARVLYVAMTRARNGCWRINPPNSEMMRKENTVDGRWFEQGYKKSLTFGVEVHGEDVDSSVPHGDRNSAAGTQAYLRTHVAKGDIVNFVDANYIPTDQGCRGSYLVLHEDRAVGRTSYSFAAALNRVLGRSGAPVRKWPVRIEGVRVECIEAVSGTEGKAREAGIGVIDIWLRPRLFGLGKFIWS